MRGVKPIFDEAVSGRVGADYVIIFAVGTFQTFFSTNKITTFLKTGCITINNTPNLHHLD